VKPWNKYQASAPFSGLEQVISTTPLGRSHLSAIAIVDLRSAAVAWLQYLQRDGSENMVIMLCSPDFAFTLISMTSH
jgi:hypothetical protein